MKNPTIKLILVAAGIAALIIAFENPSMKDFDDFIPTEIISKQKKINVVISRIDNEIFYSTFKYQVVNKRNGNVVEEGIYRGFFKNFRLIFRKTITERVF